MSKNEYIVLIYLFFSIYHVILISFQIGQKHTTVSQLANMILHSEISWNDFVTDADQFVIILMEQIIKQSLMSEN